MFPAPPIPRSAVERFLKSDKRALQGFTASDFADHFRLSAQEARDTLTGYVSNDLLTFVAMRDGQEWWAVAQEGALVYGIGTSIRARRWTKSSLASTFVKLKCLLSRGVVEISIGGRLALGLGDGSLTIGIKVDHAPYSMEGDETLVDDILKMVPAGVPVSIQMFQHLVPQRLAQRFVLVGPSEGGRIDADPAEIDIDDNYHRRAFRAMVPRWAQEDPGRVILYPTLSLQHCAQAWYIGQLPLKCQKPTQSFQDDPLTVLQAECGYDDLNDVIDLDRLLDSMTPSRGSYFMYENPGKIIAEAEYALATNALASFCVVRAEALERNLFRRFCISDDVSAETVTVAAIAARLEALNNSRSATKEKVAAKKATPQPPMGYFAAFDCLIDTQPQLAGFVRQPVSHGGSTDSMERAWSYRVGRQPHSIGARLEAAGYNSGWLSLFYRQATSEEVAAYDEVSKEFGSAVKCLIRNQDGSWIAHPVRSAVKTARVTVPVALGTAVFPLPIIPKFLFPRRRGQPSIFDAIDRLPSDQRGLVYDRVINANSVSMTEFVAACSSKESISLLPLAVGLDQWKFLETSSGWTATLSATNWSLELVQDGEVITLKIAAVDGHHRQQLAPFEPRYGLPYEGSFGSLYGLFASAQNCLLAKADDEEIGRLGQLRYLAHEVNGGLHGYGQHSMGDDGTDWPLIDIAATMREENESVGS